ncbi:Inosine/uridine-preferring nucleoside hydrolase domain-containing protein [Piptocephalis cylindrospora]|uniref:Inosine/uridine-preferring nucleoside hydrolase domain-containing protein n=1 Tax=Piptocephalis cylindrospora TaxID=1907219 RepID=A0A4P9XY49_9FUNG|nr:Inosine/uridine-preferring nucleoside hydrolase domain-containing protein [Piptocephalis cylindrospora]|eukprot:RKP11336.1 Inosine/uridine-preferring nucleoside hydrolase domain-containing protein [Piptocephalis cylindrospora]
MPVTSPPPITKPSVTPLPVVIDTDPGVDDALALILALASPFINVVALTVTYGNVALPHTLRNLVSLLGLIQQWRREAGLPELPKPFLAIGAERSLKAKTNGAEHIHGTDGFRGMHQKHPSLAPPHWDALLPKALQGLLSRSSSDIPIPDPADLPYVPSSRTAAEELVYQAISHPDDTLTLITLGPFTDLATAWSLNPEAIARYSRVVSMAGAVNIPGNISPYAEFNIWADPEAARQIFEATATPQGPQLRELILIPLNVTEKVLLLLDHFEARIPSSSPLYIFLHDFLKDTICPSETLTSSTMRIHDAVAVQYVIDLAQNHLASRGWVELGTGQGLDLRVEAQDQWTSGMIITNQRAEGARPPQNDDLIAQKTRGHTQVVGRVRAMKSVDPELYLDAILDGMNRILDDMYSISAAPDS